MLFEDKGEDGSGFIASGKTERTVVKTHDLAGKAEPDARSLLFRCIERYEDFFLTFFAYRTSVVEDIDDDMFIDVDFCSNPHRPCLGLNGIFYQIDHYLGDLTFVSV